MAGSYKGGLYHPTLKLIHICLKIHRTTGLVFQNGNKKIYNYSISAALKTILTNT